jgi:hypothetical protein
VSCSDTGAPCDVVCVSGGTATCTGNCQLTGCPVGDAG